MKKFLVALLALGASVSAHAFLSSPSGSGSGTNTGDVTLGSFGSSPNSNGITLASGQIINLEPASSSFPGCVSTSTQTFAGDKSFLGSISVGPSSNSSINADGSASFATGNSTIDTAGNITANSYLFRVGGAHMDDGGSGDININSFINLSSNGDVTSQNGSYQVTQSISGIHLVNNSTGIVAAIASDDGSASFLSGSVILDSYSVSLFSNTFYPDGRSILGGGNLEIAGDGSASFARNAVTLGADGVVNAFHFSGTLGMAGSDREIVINDNGIAAASLAEVASDGTITATGYLGNGGTLSPGSLTAGDWAGSPPATLEEALNRISAAISLNGANPIP